MYAGFQDETPIGGNNLVMCKVCIHDCMDMVCMCCSGATL